MVNDQGYRIYEAAKRRVHPTNCILCNKPLDECCNSHSIPRSILKQIDDDGWVLKTEAIMQPSEETARGERVKHTGTFRLICQDCDNKYFSNYENLKNLLIEPTDIMLAEMALKNSLLQVYKTMIEIEANKIWKNKMPDNQYLKNRTHVLIDLDLPLFTEAVKRYQRMIDSDKYEAFKILYWKLLSYRTPVAAQGHIPLYHDMDGRIVNDGHDYNTPTQPMHIAVLPLKEETFVLAFCLRENKKYRELARQMNASSDDKNLRFIFHSIMAHTENCFFSKSVVRIITASENLRTLATEIDGLPLLGEFSGTKEELEFYRKNYKSPGYFEIPNLLSEEYKIVE